MRSAECPATSADRVRRKLPPNAPVPNLVDVTAEAGLADFVTFAGERSSQLPEDMGPGAAWGDYDNDGDDDLFLGSAGGPLTAPSDRLASSALFENLAPGRFRRVSDFPEPRLIGLGAAWGDVDGDGWIDLVVTGYNSLLRSLARPDYLGTCLAETRDVEGALAQYLNPEETGALLSLGEVSLMRGQSSLARGPFRRRLPDEPSGRTGFLPVGVFAVEAAESRGRSEAPRGGAGSSGSRTAGTLGGRSAERRPSDWLPSSFASDRGITQDFIVSRRSLTIPRSSVVTLRS